MEILSMFVNVVVAVVVAVTVRSLTVGPNYLKRSLNEGGVNQVSQRPRSVDMGKASCSRTQARAAHLPIPT